MEEPDSGPPGTTCGQVLSDGVQLTGCPLNLTRNAKH
jgi:hypothetical protein